MSISLVGTIAPVFKQILAHLTVTRNQSDANLSLEKLQHEALFPGVFQCRRKVHLQLTRREQTPRVIIHSLSNHKSAVEWRFGKQDLNEPDTGEDNEDSASLDASTYQAEDIKGELALLALTRVTTEPGTEVNTSSYTAPQHRGSCVGWWHQAQTPQAAQVCGTFF